MRLSLKTDASVTYRPWLFFPIFLLTGVLLSYFPFDLETKIYFFIFGIFTPFLMAWVLRSKMEGDSFRFGSDDLSVPVWAWFVVIGVGLFARFYQLSELSVWPMLDEGRAAFFSMKILEHGGDDRLLYGASQLPPFFYWSLAAFFRFFPPSFGSLWCFSAIVSVSLIPLGYFSARRSFPTGTGFILLSLLALSFWPLYAGRFAVEGLGVLFWEFVVMLFLVFFSRSPVGQKGNGVVFLGFLTGAGFYVHLHWPFAALAILLFVLHYEKEEPGQRLLLKFLVPTLLLPLPLAFAAARGGYGTYLQSLFVSDDQHLLNDRIKAIVSYFTSLFWGSDSSLFAYKPLWGGFLNPIWGAFFWIGALEILTLKGQWYWRWFGWCFLIFLIPGFMSNNLELFRIILVMPLLFIVVAVGVVVLARSFTVDKRFLFFGVVLVLATALDLYHLFGPYHAIWDQEPQRWAGYSKSREGWQALRVFEDEARDKGPGLIFYEFDAFPMDRSLILGAREVDVHHLSPERQEQARWIGMITNLNYVPFLLKRFPSSRWVDLRMESSPMGGLAVGVIPVTFKDRALITRWTAAEKVLSDTTYDVLNLYWLQSRQGVILNLLKNYGAFKGDPFLESIFWDLVYLNSSIDGHLKDGVSALRLAIKKGYPTGYFYNELGSLMTVEKDYPAAHAAFEKAIAAPGNKTEAAANLKVLEKEEKAGQ